MSDNKFFNAKNECPQCGASCDEVAVTITQTFDHATKKWVDSSRQITGNITTTFVKIPPNSHCLCGRNGNDDHLHRKCNCCGYYWNESTLKDLHEQS